MTRRSRRGRGLNRRRRRLLGGGAVAAAGIAVAAALGLFGRFGDVLQELTLPLRHEDIIRQQAREKRVDASLIAAVIYAESRFHDQTSHAGARGLMQITPATANEIERLSGGTTFSPADLADPDINIRYGTFYLRELLDLYDQNEVAALAAYNAGPTQVGEWGGSALTLEEIPLDETRGYVADVLDKRVDYREEYGEELGY
jgi:peptidoglycan lytic transglycosylase